MSSECCTGFGASDSHAITLNDGRENKHPNAGQPYQLIGPDAILELARNPPQLLDKAAGQWMIPSAYNKYDGRSHAAQRGGGQFHWLPADIDKGNATIEQVVAAIDATLGSDIFRVIYSTASSTETVRKWRILIPLAKPIPGIEYGAYASSWYDALEAVGLVLDRALERSGQIMYLPAKISTTVYEHLISGSIGLDAQAHHMASRAAQYIKDYEQAYGDLREQASNEGPRSPLRAFRQKHSIDEMLEIYGFECNPTNADQWRHPSQSTKAYGSLRIMRYPDGDRWVSRSDTINAIGIGRSTPAGSRMGDAMDLYKHFQCEGNEKLAMLYAYKCLEELDAQRNGAATAEHGKEVLYNLSVMGNPLGEGARQLALAEAKTHIENIAISVPEDVPEGEWEIDFPEGPIGEVAKVIYNTSARPVKQYAIGAALHMVAGFFGARYNIEGFGLNLHMMIVGDSGTGKGEARRTEERIYSEVGKEIQNPQGVIQVFGHGAPASAEGLRQMFEGDYQSCATYTEDADAHLEMLMSSQPGSNGDKLRTAESQYWDNSGQGRIVGAVSYAKKENRVDALVSPALTIGRDFQVDALRAYLGARTTMRGHGPRQIFVMYEGNKVRPIRNRDKSIPDWLIKILAAQWQRIQAIAGDGVIDVKMDPETTKLFHQLEDDMLDRQDTGGQSYEVLNRVHMNAARVAGLVAASVNENQPVVTPTMFDWASRFVLTGANRALKMMTTGDVGSGEAVRVSRAVKAIYDYIRMPEGRRQSSYRVPKSLAGFDHVICESYFIEKLRSIGDFKGSDTGATSEEVIRKTIKELVLQEYLEETDVATVQASQDVFLSAKIRQRLYLVGRAIT